MLIVCFPKLNLETHNWTDLVKGKEFSWHSQDFSVHTHDRNSNVGIPDPSSKSFGKPIKEIQWLVVQLARGD